MPIMLMEKVNADGSLTLVPVRAVETSDGSDAIKAVIAKESGTPANREFIAVSSIVGDTSAYSSSDDVREIEITVTSEAVGTAELGACVGLVFDAPSAGIAGTWLTVANHITDDSEIFKVQVGETRVKPFDYPLSGIHLKRLFGSENLHVSISAVKRVV